jgi:hypothetical protein
MRIAKNRSEAIALACDMLRQGINVTGVGPMLEAGQQRIDAAAIRQICRERASVDRASGRPRVAEEAIRRGLVNKISPAGQVAIAGGD